MTSRSSADARAAGGSRYAGIRLVASLAVGVAAAAAGLLLGLGAAGLVVGWLVFCAVLLIWVWSQIGPMDAQRTRAAAQREDPSRRASGIVTVLVVVASLVSVLAFVVVSATTRGAMTVVGAIATLAVVALSWLVLQTEYTLRYAHLYYRPDLQGGPRGGLDFGQPEPPRYLDFAYYAFTVGMTYQTADVNVTSSEVRAVALRQALISFAFGAVLLAATVNLVAGIGQALA